MKSHRSSMGLMGLRLMEVSPTSPTTLEGGTSGTNQAAPAVCLVFACSLTVCRDVIKTNEGESRGDVEKPLPGIPLSRDNAARELLNNVALERGFDASTLWKCVESFVRFAKERR